MSRILIQNTMDLRLYFTELPQPSVLAALDRRFETLARKQEPVDGGRRLWITHVPETSTRPFLNAKPFDIYVAPLRFSASQIEDYRIGIGVLPKRCMICRASDNAPDTAEVLFAISSEIMSRCAALLAIDESLGRRMFQIDERELEFPSQYLDNYPGCVYEIAHELDDGELQMEWFVDARWLQAWLARRHSQSGSGQEFSRFSSLDYS